MSEENNSSTAKIASALAKAQGEFPQVKKEQTAKVKGKNKQTGQLYDYSYKYAGLPAIIDAVTPVLVKHGIAHTQIPMNDILITTLMHESGETITGKMKLPTNVPPQELGSWITYLRRYALTSMLGIAADEDDDGGSAQAGHGNQQVGHAPDPSPSKAGFEDSIHTLYDDGVSALIGHADDPKAEMMTRMTRVLGGMGFEKVSEIIDRDQQKEFYLSLRETVTKIKEAHPSPVS